MNTYLSEFLGSLIIMMIIGSVSAIALNKSLKNDSFGVKGHLLWGITNPIALLISCLLFQNSTTYFNSALTVALAVEGTLSWKVAALYIVSQAAGTFVAAVLLSLCCMKVYRKGYPIGAGFVLNGNVGIVKFTWIKEIGMTFVLVFLIKLIGRTSLTGVLQILLVAAVNLFLGIKFKAYEYCALNPVRDLMPRLFYHCLPDSIKGISDWGRGKAAWFGPLIGAIVAAWFYGLIFLVF